MKGIKQMKGIVVTKEAEAKVVWIKTENANEFVVGSEIDINIPATAPKKEEEKLIFNFDDGWGNVIIVKITPKQLEFLEKLTENCRNREISLDSWEEGYPTDYSFDFTDM